MVMVGGSGTGGITATKELLTFQHQPDATLSQINPVSETLYPVLATNTNARIIGIETDVTWAVTQPTNLTVKITIDGNTITHVAGTPISTTNYFCVIRLSQSNAGQAMGTQQDIVTPFEYEGRSIKIEASITWAVTQPSPLNCRVKWAKR